VLIFVKALWWLGALSVVLAFVGMAPGFYRIGKAAAAAPNTAAVAETGSQPFTKEIFGGVVLAALFAAALYLVYRQGSLNHLWLLFAAGLIFVAAIPGTALFFAGLNARGGWSAIVSVTAMNGAVVAIVWGLFGYSLALTEGSPVLGGFSRAFLQDLGEVTVVTARGTIQIPEINYAILHMAVLILASALVASPFARRIGLRLLSSFILLWVILVYVPVAHWVWSSDGWLSTQASGFASLLDIAGGSVVYFNAGLAGLACSQHFGSITRDPQPNTSFLLFGALLLWVGGFALNVSMASISGADVASAVLAGLMASFAAALAWIFTEWAIRGQPTASGIWLGLFAGIVAIAAGSGVVGPMQGLLIGLAGGALGSISISLWGRRDGTNYCLIYAVGGLVGVLLTGLFGLNGGAIEAWHQCLGVAVVGAYSLFGSFIILNVLSWFDSSGVPEPSEQSDEEVVRGTGALATD
jgi:ammonium transporter, Amt family